MAYTLGGIRTKILNKLDDSGLSSTKVDDWINDAQNECVEGFRLPFMETRSAFTLTVGDPDITSGVGVATLDEPIAVRITTGGSEQVLKYIQYDELIRRFPDFPNTDNGTPEYWYEFAGEINTFPASDTAYSVALDFYKKPTELTGDSDVPELPAQYEELLVIGGYIRALEHDDDYDEAAVQRLIWDNKHINMVRKVTQKSDGPSVIGINRRRVSRYVRGA